MAPALAMDALAKGDTAARAKTANYLNRAAGNKAVQRLAGKERGDDAQHTVTRTSQLVMRSPMVQRRGQRYGPPPGTATGRLPGRVALEDVGDTRTLQQTIIDAMPAAMTGAGKQGIANVRSTYTHDNLQNHVINMTNGTPLSTQITGQDSHDDYTGDVSVTARATNFRFLRADEVGLTGTVSQSQSGATGSSSTTTGISGTGEASAGGDKGAPGGKVGVGVSGSDTTGGSATMGGSTSRGTGAIPSSVMFTCDIVYDITVRFGRSPRTGWSIASLGLVNLVDAITEGSKEWTRRRTTTGAGAQVRFAGADCVPAE